jgi:hypothetical protein
VAVFLCFLSFSLTSFTVVLSYRYEVSISEYLHQYCYIRYQHDFAFSTTHNSILEGSYIQQRINRSDIWQIKRGIRCRTEEEEENRKEEKV